MQNCIYLITIYWYITVNKNSSYTVVLTLSFNPLVIYSIKHIRKTQKSKPHLKKNKNQIKKVFIKVIIKVILSYSVTWIKEIDSSLIYYLILFYQ